ncbi:hypothetical protein H1Q63_10780 [Desmonostoc muscorum CCALA 125]|nr:hypothetical protein [Desmonostoc muscorum CCALA 125]
MGNGKSDRETRGETCCKLSPSSPSSPSSPRPRVPASSLQVTPGFLKLGLQDRLLSIHLALDGF